MFFFFFFLRSAWGNYFGSRATCTPEVSKWNAKELEKCRFGIFSLQVIPWKPLVVTLMRLFSTFSFQSMLRGGQQGHGLADCGGKWRHLRCWQVLLWMCQPQRYIIQSSKPDPSGETSGALVVPPARLSSRHSRRLTSLSALRSHGGKEHFLSAQVKPPSDGGPPHK